MTKKRNVVLLIFIISISILFTATACSDFAVENNTNEENLRVHFIDVGQGDAILIQTENRNMLIDAGDNSYGQLVVDYLRDKGVSRLDYLIGTHPHADHIGGLDEVIKNFEIGTIIMPKLSHDTKTYEDVLLAVQEKGLKINTPKITEPYELEDVKWTMLAPNSEEYESLNNYSVVVKLEYGKRSFLFTGDAESLSEGEMLELHRRMLKGIDVLKIGHHGSSSSTSDEFLDVVNPKIAVIQLGENNKYGHPHEETMEKLENKDIEIYRNDLNGNIILTSDGDNINVELQVESNAEDGSLSKEENNSVQYIGNKNSKVLHLESCEQLPAEKNRVYFTKRQEAIEENYKPCQRCNP
jgi:competence protein ComEC